MFIPPWCAPHALSHSGPSKEIHHRSLKPPSRPQLDYRLVHLGTNPIGSAAYLPLPLPPVYLPLEAFACDKPSVSLELARENPWEKAGEELPRGYPIGPGCPLGLMLCLIRMLGHPKSPAANPDQACNQPDIDTARQTLGLDEALVQAPNCAS